MKTEGQQTDNIANSETKDKKRLMSIEPNELSFTFCHNNVRVNQIVLPIGYNSIAVGYFKHTIPTVSEVDYAINVIEDALMSNKALVNNSEQLYASSALLSGLLIANVGAKNVFSRQEIEELFTQYANVSMGVPQLRYGIEVNSIDFALLLLVRETMHHLNFEQLQCS